MLEELKFVLGAVAKESHIPALTHFHIEDGVIRGFNGTLQLSTPIAINLNISPNAKQFVTAIQTCKEPISLTLNDNGKLVVTSKNFKCFVDCVPKQDFPKIEPDGEVVALNESFLPALKIVEKFVVDNNERNVWAQGVLLKEGSLFATDNLSMAQYWIDCNFPFDINIPHPAVKELIRINEQPTLLKVNDRNATFKYEDGKYLTTCLRVDTWPNISKILNKESNQVAMPENFFETLERILPFTNHRDNVYFFGDKMTTSQHYDKEGTVIDLPGLPQKGCYNTKSLLLLKGIADTIDFSNYPNANLFYGKNVRGGIIGLTYHD